METALTTQPLQTSLSVDVNSRILNAKLQNRVNLESSQSITDLLGYCLTILGTREENYPNDIEQPILISHIKGNMSRWSLMDFQIAFQLLVAGSLDFDRKDLNKISPDAAYSNKFSPLYLDNVMQSYNRYRVNVLEKAKEVDHDKLLEETLKPSDAEKEAINRNGCLNAFAAQKAGRPWLDFGNVKFNYLEKCGNIVLTDERKEDLMKCAKSVLIQRGEKSIGEVLVGMQKMEAKRIALEQYFNFLIETNQELSEVI